MGALLERARQVLGGGAMELPPAEPFEVRCACGADTVGYRIDSRQFIRCSGCGALIFVLPASAYPKPIVQQSRPAAAALPVELVPPKPPLSERVGEAFQSGRRGLAAVLWALVPPARWFSPLRLTMMGIVGIVAGTVFLTIHLGRRSSLTGDFRAARAEWTKRLEAADFDAARKILDEAAASLRRYGGERRDLLEVEQLASEVGLVADLADRSLAEIIRDVEAGSGDIAGYFRDTLHHPAIIVDTHVAPATGPQGGTAGFRIDSRLAAGNATVRFDLNGFALVERLAPAIPTRVIFGARVLDMERAGAGEYVVRFVPDSGALMTMPDLLERLGWPVDEPTRARIKEQADAILAAP